MVNPFGKWFDAKLRESGLTAAELARMTKFKESTISNVRSGSRDPGMDFLQKVAAPLGVTVIEIYRAAGLLPEEGEVLIPVEVISLHGLDDYHQILVREFVGMLRRLARREMDD